MTKVSVIIPARNSIYIRKTIASLEGQDQKPDEIIVVVNRNDITPSYIADYITAGFVRIIEVDSPADLIRDTQWKRRIGAESAKGEILLFTDSKIILAPDAIRRSVELIAETHVDAVGGRILCWPEQQKHLLAQVQDKALVQPGANFESRLYLDKNNFGKTFGLPVTAILAMTRYAYEKVRDDFAIEFSFVALSYDDYALDWLLVRNGLKILATNEVIAYHKHRLTMADLMLQLSRSGQSASLLYFYYPDCPLGHRRLAEVLALLGMGSLGLITSVIAISLGGLPALGAILVLALAFYLVLALANMLKAKTLAGLVLPALTLFLAGIFAFHFMKVYLKRGNIKPQEVLSYLQIL